MNAVTSSCSAASPSRRTCSGASAWVPVCRQQSSWPTLTLSPSAMRASQPKRGAASPAQAQLSDGDRQRDVRQAAPIT